MPRKGFSGFATVYTRASTASGERRFFPLTGLRDAADIKSVHWQLDVWALTGDLLLERAFQEGDDPESWPSASTFTVIGATTATADGLTAGSGYENVTLAKSNMRFGVAVRNNQSGARIELCWVSGRFDTRSC
jgi:hypothetical protein